MLKMDLSYSRPDDIDIIVIGAGGNGSHFLRTFASLDYLNKLVGYQNFRVTVFDDDIIEDHNTGRQAFNKAAVGRSKSENICSRINLTYDFKYKAIPELFDLEQFTHPRRSTIFILAVDDAGFRVKFYKKFPEWDVIDMGNGDSFGQVYFYYGLQSKKTTEHKNYIKALRQVAKSKSPSVSCSHIESVRNQGLYVNNQVALIACNWLYNIFMFNPARVPIMTYFNSESMVMTNVMSDATYGQRIQSPLV